MHAALYDRVVLVYKVSDFIYKQDWVALMSKPIAWFQKNHDTVVWGSVHMILGFNELLEMTEM